MARNSSKVKGATPHGLRTTGPPKDPGLAQQRLQRGDEDLVRLYLTDIGRHPLLTREDEVRLAQEIESGSAAAERTLVQANLRLVV